MFYLLGPYVSRLVLSLGTHTHTEEARFSCSERFHHVPWASNLLFEIKVPV